MSAYRSPEGYDDAHRLLVQAFMSEGYLSAEDAEDRWNRAWEAVHGNGDDAPERPRLDTRVHTINAALRAVDMALVSGKAPDDGTLYYTLANTRSDEVAQLATVYEPVEVDFLKHILAMIFRDSGMTYEVSSSDAQNAASQAQGRKFTKAEAETFLKSLVKEGWLRDRNGYYSLAIRSLLELKAYLKDEFAQDIVGNCTICSDPIMTPGYQSCKDSKCDCYLHQACADVAFGNVERRKCPSCKQPWEPVVRDRRSSQRVGGMVGASGRRRTVVQDEEDEEDDGTEVQQDDGAEPSGAAAASQEAALEDSDGSEIAPRASKRRSGRR